MIKIGDLFFDDDMGGNGWEMEITNIQDGYIWAMPTEANFLDLTTSKQSLYSLREEELRVYEDVEYVENKIKLYKQ